MRTFKHVFFKDREIAERFTKVYGGSVDEPDTEFGKWFIKYFGPKTEGMYLVVVRMSTDEINDVIKNVGIRKKRLGGKSCYFYE